MAAVDDLPGHEFQANVTFTAGTLSASIEKFVPAGQEVVLRRPAATAINGAVAWAGGDAAGGASLLLMDGDIMIFMTTADRDGRFSVLVPSEGAGPYRLKAQAKNGASWVSVERAIARGDHDVRIEIAR